MEATHIAYAPNLYHYKRIRSREVYIGDIPVGGDNPIRIQSMTTTDTMDTQATVEQSIRMYESGAEYVRITAPSKKEAENLKNIRDELRKRGCPVPLIADIHYTPNAAEIAARIVEKVRVNPGNYADKKKFQTIEYTDDAYQAELDRIHERFAPLVKICKEHGTAMRIGTNHGSLSDRIMSRYGDTPLGMVESAMEFLRICEHYDYHDIVLSMKASNTQVMVQAYRLLMQQMQENGIVYPLHLGVTEAGEGEDGRIKSAQGIATLLMDGIGDTVRVSLTEEPEYESPVAKFLVDIYQAPGYPSPDLSGLPLPQVSKNPFEFERRNSREVLNLGHSQVPRVVAEFSENAPSRANLYEIGYQYSEILDKYNIAEMATDFIYLGDKLPGIALPGALKEVYNYETWQLLRKKEDKYPLFASLASFLSAEQKNSKLNFISVSWNEMAGVLEKADSLSNVALVIEGAGRGAGHQWRFAIHQLLQAGLDLPVVLSADIPEAFEFYDDSEVPVPYRISEDAKKQLFMASITGTMMIDGLVDGLWLRPGGRLSTRTSFGILQAGRLRITKTEYISCPSCGRTLFDLQETTARIRKRTEHLKGVKIGIMGCIVNGPGEMADADYGYVGVGVGKISLYRGKEVVERSVKTEEAVDKLIDLIREDGNWVDPPN